MNFWYGLVSATALYGIFTVLVALLVEKECLNEPCNSEGLDTTVLGFATDFFIAAGFIALGLHLYCRSALYTKYAGVWTLVFMGLAYVLGGLGHSIWTNSGYDDNLGQQEYYIAWAVSFSFMTMSVLASFMFVRQIWMFHQEETLAKNKQARLELVWNISLVLVILAWVATVTGYVWCATDTDLHTNGAIDEEPELEDDDTLQTCLYVAFYGEFSWYLTFSIFWVPTGSLLRRYIRSKPSLAHATIYGMPVQLAALCLIWIQWTFGIMLIFWVGIVALILDEDGAELYADSYAAVIYHFGMWIHYFLFHNVAIAVLDHDHEENWSPQDLGASRPTKSAEATIF